MDEETRTEFEGRVWAIVELLGRNVLAGEVSEVTIAGAPMLRIDVPEILMDGKVDIPGFTKYVGGRAIYGITPTDEATARMAVLRVRSRPISLYTVSSAQMLPRQESFDDGEDDEWGV